MQGINHSFHFPYASKGVHAHVECHAILNYESENDLYVVSC